MRSLQTLLLPSVQIIELYQYRVEDVGMCVGVAFKIFENV